MGTRQSPRTQSRPPKEPGPPRQLPPPRLDDAPFSHGREGFSLRHARGFRQVADQVVDRFLNRLGSRS